MPWAFLLGVTALTSGCKAKQDVTTMTAPPPPSGFKNENKFDRRDDDGGSVPVYVAVGDNAIIVNSSNAGSSDVALGWIANAGQKKEKRYGFRPSDKATYILYARSAANGGGWRIEEDPTGGGPTNPSWKTGQFSTCDTHNANVPDVGFKDCGGTVSSTPAMLKSSSMTGGLFSSMFTRILAVFMDKRDPPSLDAPGWAACTEGCCSW
jgi:hypothetical protein